MQLAAAVPTCPILLPQLLIALVEFQCLSLSASSFMGSIRASATGSRKA